MTGELRERLEELRQGVLALHKAVVDSERVTYEATVGTIQSPNHFLQLLTGDPWFAWLQPLSQLIVSMDEAQDPREELSAAVVEASARSRCSDRACRCRETAQSLINRAGSSRTGRACGNTNAARPCGRSGTVY